MRQYILKVHIIKSLETYFALRGLVNIVTTGLSNADFVKITDGKTIYFGGNQDWFGKYTQDYGGCGPTAAANILAYMSMTDSRLEKLYGYDIKNITREDFSKFMEEVYKFVTPFEIPFFNNMSDKKGKSVGIPSIGITDLSAFSRGVEKFAKSRGVSLKANWSSESPDFENAVGYIREGLKKDRPVALINMFDSVNMQFTAPGKNACNKKCKQHWVTITAMTEDMDTGSVSLEVSTWGGKGIFLFNDLWDNDWTSLLFPEGIVYFEAK